MPSPRALNRALLERQMLLRRRNTSVEAAVEHLVGMQAQAPMPPYFGLWTRLERFAPDDLARLILDRRVVRMVLMRGTIHLVSARDALALRPLVQPILDRDLATNRTVAPDLAGMDLAALAAAGRALLEEKPRTAKELGALLQRQWPDRNAASMAHGVRNLLPLVQVPPRGIWGASGASAHTTVEAWLGRGLKRDPSLDEMVLRYLAAFGPATVADVQTWSGLKGLGEVIDRLRPRLRTFRAEHRRELFDVPDGPLPDPDAPAPARFVPPYDNVLLSHADRTRVIADAHRRHLRSVNGVLPGTVLLDGFVRGTWELVQHRGSAVLRITPFQALSAPDRAELTDEGARLLAFAAPAAPSRDVQFTRRAPG